MPGFRPSTVGTYLGLLIVDLPRIRRRHRLHMLCPPSEKHQALNPTNSLHLQRLESDHKDKPKDGVGGGRIKGTWNCIYANPFREVSHSLVPAAFRKCWCCRDPCARAKLSPFAWDLWTQRHTTNGFALCMEAPKIVAILTNRSFEHTPVVRPCEQPRKLQASLCYYNVGRTLGGPAQKSHALAGSKYFCLGLRCVVLSA